MTSSENLKRIACDVIDDERSRLVEISREIWSNPELAFNEVKASKLLVKYLKQHNFQVSDCDTESEVGTISITEAR